LTPERVAATRLYARGANAHLAIESFPAVALLTNFSLDFAVPDEAAAATTMATGVKVNNRSIGMAADGRKLRTIIDLARDQGRTIGLVTNARLTDPTSAAFYAASKESAPEIARQLADEKKIDIALGGGSADFLPEAKGGRRTDGRDLVLEMRRNGYEIVRTKAELEGIPQWRRPKLLGIFSESEMAYADEIAAGSEQPALADMTRRAIQLLQWNTGGYLLIVDAGLMRAAARENQGERTLAETSELDQAIATAQSYVGKNSTILVAGNLGIGGLSLNGFPFRRDTGVALGPRSRAGLMQAMVRGASTMMMNAMMKPMKRAKSGRLGANELRVSTAAKTTMARMKVANASASTAVGVLTMLNGHFCAAAMAGFGE